MGKIDLFHEEQNSVFDVVINGSSAGLTGEFDNEEVFTNSNTYFYDLNYSLTETFL